MAGKSIRLLQIITSPHLYRELFRWLVYYLYEHVLPLKNLQVGTDPEIHPTVSLRFEKNIHLGNKIVLDMNCCIWASPNSKITVGDNTGVGPGTIIISSNHSFFSKESYTEQPINEKDIVIGKNVWIGANSSILAGAHIGDNVIIGSGVVVTGRVPEDSIVVSGSRKLSMTKRR
ncbi:MAG: acyltransferase [Nitrospina sp.]|jgi:acetyltransferase-like isoleucine patch superfamily enzyme|nr:acyltransferase [Nitrospina sp.]MBT4620873.1 acyltransferase [Nitrospina sp.]MBT6597334.1 acyltransferase [Nitrospina sp.]MBT7180626.1 acyltransferase [Nitrospina sp.]MBT7936471.1 acyltransferase [Nitrospina sp.]